MVDDDGDNVFCNPQNAYVIAFYMGWEEERRSCPAKGNAAQDAGDTELLWLSLYLKLVKDEPDIRTTPIFEKGTTNSQSYLLKNFVTDHAHRLPAVDRQTLRTLGLLPEAKTWEQQVWKCFIVISQVTKCVKVAVDRLLE